MSKYVRHFRNNGIYEVIMEVQHHESLEQMVIYKNTKTGQLWAREKEGFEARVESVDPATGIHYAGPRFIELQIVDNEHCNLCNTVGALVYNFEGTYCTRCGK